MVPLRVIMLSSDCSECGPNRSERTGWWSSAWTTGLGRSGGRDEYSEVMSGRRNRGETSACRVTPQSLCVIMPALNEADGVVDALSAMDDELSALHSRRLIDRYEVLLVDDGSTDRTVERAMAASRSRPAIRVVCHDRNRGVGAALQTGLTHVTTDLVLYTDADMPVDLAEIEPALALVGQPDVGLVVGYRKGFDGEPWVRRAASGVYDVLARCLFGVGERDVNFPFKMLRAEDARALGLRSEGAFVDVELLARARSRGLRIEALEMTYRMRSTGESKTMTPRVLGRLLLEMLSHGLTLRRLVRR